MTTTGVLAGHRALVVEDEMLVSLLIEDALTSAGCIVVGPYDDVAQALYAIPNEAIDFAVLDVNVNGVLVYPVAEMLEQRNVPFLLLSGYGRQANPRCRPNWRVCSKPFREAELLDILSRQLRGN